MKGKLLLLVVLAVGLFCCRKDKYDFSEKTNYSCVPRTCEAITARNFERYIVPKKNESSKDIFQEKALEGESVSASDYLIRVDIGPRKLTGRIYWFEYDEISTHDYEIERQIMQYLEGSPSYVQTRTVMVDVEYRTEEVVGIRLTPVVEGETFEPVGDDRVNIWRAGNYQNFIISYDKRLVGEVGKETPLEKYLSFRPMITATMFLQLKQYDGLVGRKSRFAVEVEMRNGKVMRDTTAAVILR